MNNYFPSWEFYPKRDKTVNDGFTVSGAFYSTPAIEYNLYMSIFGEFSEIAKEIAKDYNFKKEISIIPEFPKDLKKLQTPTIAVRYVTHETEALTNGGTYHIDNDTPYGIDVDSYMQKWYMTIQFDCVGENHYERMILKSIANDTLIRMNKFPLRNYTVKVHGEYEKTKFDETVRAFGIPSGWNLTMDTLQYIGIIRQGFTVNNVIVPKEELVDLSTIELDYTLTDENGQTATTTGIKIHPSDRVNE